MSEDSKVVRWDGYRITHLGYTVNLILSLSVASLGFALSLVTKDGFSLQRGWNAGCFSFSLFLLTLSIAVGLICVLNRLYDFRITARNARSGKNDKANTRELGEITWLLFYFQIAIFAVAFFMLSGSTMYRYCSVLFPE